MHDDLNEILRGVTPKSRARESVEAIDAPQEDLGPCAWVFPKPVAALDIEDGAKEVQTLHYMYHAVRATYKPGEFVVIFAGHEHFKLTVQGRNLRPVYDRINESRVRKIRTVSRDFGQDDGKPFITRIEVLDVTPEG
jgi:hypothetical protein